MGCIFGTLRTVISRCDDDGRLCGRSVFGRHGAFARTTSRRFDSPFSALAGRGGHWIRQYRNLARLVFVRHGHGLAKQVYGDDAVLDLLHSARHDFAHGECMTLVRSRTRETMREGSMGLLLLLPGMFRTVLATVSTTRSGYVARAGGAAVFALPATTTLTLTRGAFASSGRFASVFSVWRIVAARLLGFRVRLSRCSRCLVLLLRGFRSRCSF
jgi:hypothetical protein